MGRERIDYEALVGGLRSNKKNQKFEIKEYKGRNKGRHYFEIEFLKTKNREIYHYRQLTGGTAYDTRAIKLEKQLKKIADLKARKKAAKEAKSSYDLSGISSSRVLSVDLATQEVGVTWAEDGVIKESWHLSAPKEKSTTERAFWIATKLKRAVEKLGVDFILLEGVHLGLNSSVLQILVEARGLFLYTILERGIRYEILPAAKWKGHFPRMKGQKRDGQKAIAKEMFQENMGYEGTEDQADSYCMLKAALDLEEVKCCG